MNVKSLEKKARKQRGLNTCLNWRLLWPLIGPSAIGLLTDMMVALLFLPSALLSVCSCVFDYCRFIQKLICGPAFTVCVRVRVCLQRWRAHVDPALLPVSEPRLSSQPAPQPCPDPHLHGNRGEGRAWEGPQWPGAGEQVSRFLFPSCFKELN